MSGLSLGEKFPLTGGTDGRHGRPGEPRQENPREAEAEVARWVGADQGALARAPPPPPTAPPVPGRGGGQPIVFWRSGVTGRWLPIEEGATVVRSARQEDGERPTLVIRGVNHFSRCPEAERFRRR